jgi:hypothetical protein
MLKFFNKNNYTKIATSILAVLISLYFIYIINYSKIINEWSLVELLINYQGGFVRRGLLGELNLFFEKRINFPNLLFSIFTISLFYFANIYITFLRLLKFNNKNNYFLFFFIFLSPATFLFYIYDLGALFRKDVFIIFSIIIHCFYVQLYYEKSNFISNYKKKLFIIIFILCVITLIHEAQFFMLPFHILLSYSILRNVKLTLFYYSFPVIFFLIIFIFKGNYLVAQGVRESLTHYPSNIIYQDYNAIHFLEGNLNLIIGGFLKFFFRYTYLQTIELLTAVFLSIILFWNILSIYFTQFFIENKSLQSINLKFFNDNIYKFFFISFLCFLFMGFDSGRAIHILLMHIISLYLIFIPKKIPSIFLLKNNKYKYFLLFFLFFYISSWTLHHGYIGISGTIFKSGFFFNLKIIISYIVKFLSDIISFPIFLVDFSKEYLIFNSPVKF